MKAAVMYATGEGPRYVEVPDPVIRNSDEVLITVKAAAIKHVDRSRASGKHYSSEELNSENVNIIGSDGVGKLPDGTRIYAVSGDGMLAEKAVIDKDRLVVIPDRVDDATAAALPNAVMGSAMGMRFRANMQKDDVVLINGATGFTGQVAVQIAKYYGASKVIATGRNPESLKAVRALGADEIISLEQNDDDFLAKIRALHNTTPIDIIIDYVWGHPAELLLAALKGRGAFTHPVRYVSVGSMAGDNIQLSAAILRSVDLYLSGSGLGSWTREEVDKLFHEILPNMFQLAADKQLQIETVTMPITDIESIYDVVIPAGKRLVVTLN